MESTKLLAVLYFIGGVASLVAIITFLFEKIKKIDFISLMILMLLSWWSFGYYFWLNAGDYIYADYLAGFFNLGFIFLPVSYYFWVVTLLGKRRKISVGLGYLASGIFSLIYLINLYGNSLKILDLASWQGLLFIGCFVLIYLGFYLGSIAELLNVIIENKSKEKRVMDKNILLISSLILILGILNLSAFYGVKYLLFGGIVLIFFNIFLLTYVAIKNSPLSRKMFQVQLLVALIVGVNVVELLLSDRLVEVMYRSLMLTFLIFFSSLLIKNYKQDIIQKEELLKLGKKMETNNKKLKELDGAKNEFISIAAHQLRTPPTVIKGYLSLAKEDPNNNLDEETKDSLARAFASNERLIELVEDILNISRIESGKMQYEFKPNQSCEKIINDLNNNFQIKAADKGLKLTMELPKHEVPNITMDSNKIREVISNLIDNSIKYTDKGSIKISLKKTDYGMVRVEVSDTGMGISKNEIGSLFKKFSRGSNADQLAAGGIGLGIYVGRKIIEAHKGKIWAQSAGIEKGATFIIELPIDSQVD
ncbi:MAG: HAMP domain-containing sensor histidine kinase [Candidatus Moraniibacteriota bacterium]